MISRPALFRRDWLEGAQRARPAYDGRDEAETGLSSILWQLSFRTMLSSLLRFGDRLSMAHSREVRLPFCDPRVAELAFSLPPELLVGDGQVKRVLRLAIDGLVPPEIVTRPKQGFVPPQQRWLTGPLEGWVRELANDAPALLPCLDAHVVRTLAAGTREARTREVASLWDTANLLAWARHARLPLQHSAAFDAQLDGGAQLTSPP